MMRPAEFFAQPRSTREKGHLVAGLKYVWRTDELRRPLIVLAIMFTFVFEWQVLMPLLAEVSFIAGPREFGLLSAAAGIGPLIGAVTTAHGNKHPGMRRLGVFSLLVGGSMVSWRSRRRSISPISDGAARLRGHRVHRSTATRCCSSTRSRRRAAA